MGMGFDKISSLLNFSPRGKHICHIVLLVAIGDLATARTTGHCKNHTVLVCKGLTL